ncbi:N-formylglutamate amidohydrolase [Sphingobium sufflavum]|uniref:N-formylglutamate amidohydrolase n=1 Tax=Sphingobium sufflavum TaxID=1129547 RepID=UPI001F263BB7|nr:N-formylglutamate amidohydrolase [Sphingobium sufflavum]MCE7795703.1 N-formylglutamate amidohydrolase [Sphingobium sufflavum]
MDSERSQPLIGPDDPPPVRVTNPGGRSSFLLIGDHAGRAIPARLGSLGLGQADLARHIACDIGVAGLGRRLAGELNACFIEQVYSRLVIDCNRPEGHGEAFVEESDGTVITGNGSLDARARAERRAAIATPYQAAIAAELARRDAQGTATVLVALHSFTPVMQGVARPWDIGVLHDGGDTGFARALLARLRGAGGVVVGDNEPYRMDATDHSVPLHAYAARRPYAELEVRQDHLSDAAGQSLWAARLAAALQGALADG